MQAVLDSVQQSELGTGTHTQTHTHYEWVQSRIYLPQNGKRTWGSTFRGLIQMATDRVSGREQRWYLSSVSSLKQQQEEEEEVPGIRAAQEGMWTMRGCHVTALCQDR